MEEEIREHCATEEAIPLVIFNEEKKGKSLCC